MIISAILLIMNLVLAFSVYRLYQQIRGIQESLPINAKTDWESERKALEERFSVQLRSMRLLYEQTQKVLEDKQWELHKKFPPSVEESELKQALSFSDPAAPLLTLDQFEKEKDQFNSQCSLDLKSLLSEQLS